MFKLIEECGEFTQASMKLTAEYWPCPNEDKHMDSLIEEFVDVELSVKILKNFLRKDKRYKKWMNKKLNRLERWNDEEIDM